MGGKLGEADGSRLLIVNETAGTEHKSGLKSNRAISVFLVSNTLGLATEDEGKLKVTGGVLLFNDAVGFQQISPACGQ